MRSSNIFTIILIIILIVIGFWFFTGAAGSPSETASSTQSSSTKTYANTAFGYSFAYPETLALVEYSPKSVVIGNQDGSSIDALVEADIETADASSSASSYDAFVANRVKTLCAADGPNESYACTGITSTTPYTSASGVSGEKLTLALVHTVRTAGVATSTDSFGPVYVFNISANVPQSPFAALLVYQPLATYLSTRESTSVDQVAHSIKIEKIETRQ